MTTPNLDLEPLVSAQAQKHVTVNEALARIDAATQLAVLDRDAPAPPASPDDGDRYLLPANATGAWSGHDGEIAAWEDATAGWLFLAPRPGWRLWVIDEDSLLVLTEGGWQRTGGGGASVNPVSGGLLGVNATADATNRLAVKSDAVLLSHDDVTPGTGGMQLKFNKATATDTASLLYQTGFSGRAEFGLAGSDDFSIKTSPDGSTFTTALTVEARTARVSFPETSFAALLRRETGPNAVARRYVADTAWLSSASAVDNDWRAVCWSPELGLFCAVSNTGTGDGVMTSPDGIVWTARTSAADNSWFSVCWSPELRLFCAVASSGTGDRVMTSPDGIAWTARASAADNNWYGICWSPELGLFCAVANSGSGDRVMTSPDGIAWTAHASAVANSWRDVCWSPELGLFCTVSNGGTGDRVMTSPDGTTWTARASAADNGWLGVCWSPELGLFCAVANSGAGDRAMTSVSAHGFPYRS